LKMIHLLSSHSFLLHFTINQVLWGTLQQNPVFAFAPTTIIPAIKSEIAAIITLKLFETFINFSLIFRPFL
ncbi:hypothetical protein, partial [Lactococcus lactis]